jgi:hypothetical protein
MSLTSHAQPSWPRLGPSMIRTFTNAYVSTGSGVHLAWERSTGRQALPPRTAKPSFVAIASINVSRVGVYSSGCRRLSVTSRTLSSCVRDSCNQRSSVVSLFSCAEIRSRTSGLSEMRRTSGTRLLVVQTGSDLHPVTKTMTARATIFQEIPALRPKWLTTKQASTRLHVPGGHREIAEPPRSPNCR